MISGLKSTVRFLGDLRYATFVAIRFGVAPDFAPNEERNSGKFSFTGRGPAQGSAFRSGRKWCHVRHPAGRASDRDRVADGDGHDSGLGEAIIIDAFVVAVIGGLGSLKGAFFGALIIGLLSSFGTRYIPTFDMFLTFILMAVVLLWRPQGFFGETS